MKKVNYLERSLNKSSSLITSFTNLFTIMVLILGLITGFSAFKEVSREVYTCLDEKFSLVLYSTAENLSKKNDIKDKKITSVFNHYKIGDVGFSAVIDDSNKKDVKILFLSEDAKFTKKHLEKSFKDEKDMSYCINNAYRPKGFMDLNFPIKQMDIKIDNEFYRVRMGKTDIKDVYIMVGAGHDQYYYKMIRIIFNAIVLTLIAVPITIYLTRRVFKILAKQILSLESQISSLENSLSLNNIDSNLYNSKNEIGHLANSIKKLTLSLDKKSKIDDLTQIYNRRMFNERMREVSSLIDEQTPISILFTDIDYFKKYNDFYGHVSGDVCLKRVASVLFDTVRKYENVQAFRYGGEEFTLLCVDYDKEDAINIAKEVATNIKKENIEHNESLVSNQVTLSIGIATDIMNNKSLDEILIDADKAVYNSKENGRNRYTHYSDI